MRLEVIGGCSGGTCPTVYTTDRGTAVVQGFVVTDAEALATANPPAGETLVEIPLELLAQVAGKVLQ